MRYTDLGAPQVYAPMAAPAGYTDAQTAGIPNPPAKRLIIKSATINGEVEDYQTSASRIENGIAALNGFVVSSSLNLVGSNSRRGSISVRVPSEHFDSALSVVTGVCSKVFSQSIRGNDVTEEFVDVVARLINQRRVETRYREILKSARTVSDILEIERSLAQVRGEIERFEARQKYLQDQVALSTIDISLAEPKAAVEVEGPGFWDKIRFGFRKGFIGFGDMLSLSITALISGIPIIALLGMILFLAFTFVRRFRRQRSASALQPKDMKPSRRQPA